MKTGVELIAEERQRQMSAEGYSTQHDDAHREAELAAAAGCYALIGAGFLPYNVLGDYWPLDWNYKPYSKERALVIAGALIAAEIDRIHRRTERTYET